MLDQSKRGISNPQIVLLYTSKFQVAFQTFFPFPSSKIYQKKCFFKNFLISQQVSIFVDVWNFVKKIWKKSKFYCFTQLIFQNCQSSKITKQKWFLRSNIFFSIFVDIWNFGSFSNFFQKLSKQITKIFFVKSK